jgi:membrane protein
MRASESQDEAARRAHFADISPAGWRKIGKRVFAKLGENNLTLIAAGVAFYGMLAIFPALTALISVYRLVADPADVHKLLNAGVLPPGVASLLQAQTHTLGGGHGMLGISVIIGFILTLWSARQGANAITRALDIAYGRLTPRGFLRRIGFDLGFTLATILFAIVALIVVIVVPALLARLQFGAVWHSGLAAIRWPILLLLIGGGLALTYRYAPNRRPPPWRWVVVGATAATVLWLIGSALFSLYVGHFASYSRTYGTVGTVVVLLLWLFISALIILLGAELNVAIETQATQARGESEPTVSPNNRKS